MAEKENWGKNLAYFGAGVVVGAGTTVIAGHLSNGKVPVPEKMQIPGQQGAAQTGTTKQG